MPKKNNLLRKITILFFLLGIHLFSLGAISLPESDTVTCFNTFRYFERLDTLAIDSLELVYGTNKKFVKDYKQQCLLALSYYPELKEVKIKFKYSRRENTTMACRPGAGTFLGHKRSYRILINRNKHFDGIHLEHVPFNAQIGIISHEIAHIVDYENSTIREIIRTGINYLNETKKKIYEHFIDLIVIEKGLGWQLYDWAVFSMFDAPHATESYKEFKRNTYMNPEQIIQEMKTINCYNQFFM
jgi:hypothetical protein